MAKLSELKKVELLESAVLTGTIDEVIAIMEEYSPFEFSARALGYAARFRGADMVKCLINHGVSFAYEPTQNINRKYKIKIPISNKFSYYESYDLYLIADYPIQPEVKNIPVLDGEERAHALETLAIYGEKIGLDMQELLYHAVFFGDPAIRDMCKQLGVCTLSQRRSAIVCLETNYIYLDRIDQYFRDELTWRLREVPTVQFKQILMDLLPLLGDKTMRMLTADLYFHTDKKQGFYSTYCTEGLFELMCKHTNLKDKVKKWELIYGLVDMENTAGLQDVLEQKWISKYNDMASLLEYIQKKETQNTAMIALVMQYVEQTKPKKATAKKEFSLDVDPLSPSAIKKNWSFEENEDGTIVITSYKGNDVEVVVPAEINGKPVVEIGKCAFSPNKSKLTAPKKEFRKAIASVCLPDGLKYINDEAFCGCISLLHVNISQTLKKIGNQAFCGCDSLREVSIPETVTKIGFRAFASATYLGDNTNLVIYGKTGSEAEKHAMWIHAKFIAE